MSRLPQRLARRAGWCVFVIGLFASNAVAQFDPALNDQASMHIRQMIEALSARGHLVIKGNTVGAANFMREFYSRRQYQPAWTDQKNMDDLIAAVKESERDGLSPQDFHQPVLDIVRSPEGFSALELAGRDVVLTDALVRLGYQLFYGKVDPSSLDANWNVDRPLDDDNPAELVEQALRDRRIPELLASLRPNDRYYDELVNELAQTRLDAEKEQVQVPDGPALRKGDQGGRVAALRDRLGLSPGTLFDEDLDSAVRAFQDDQRLAVDGVVGRQSIAALNAGPEQRIEKLRINLDRARWLRDVARTGRHVVVNIAGFRVYLIEDDRIIWETRAIVGKPYRKTPLFKNEIKYLVLNPTWTPTPRMVRDDIAPKYREDPNYLAAHNMVVYDGSGAQIDAATADWSKPGRYRVVQQPGPDNALGEVKFMFPNKHHVYLHDTPSRNLFDENERAFSSGCIRVDDPIELARRLLADQPSWQPETIDATLASGETKTVHLSEPVPVYLLYWTANPLMEGPEIEYLPDVYERDQAVLEALDATFGPLDF